MAMIGKVKQMNLREKQSVREIVRLTSLSRKTVRKWLKAAVLEEPRYRRSEALGKFTLFQICSGLRPARLPQREQRSTWTADKPGIDPHSHVVDRHAASVHPRVSTGSTGWANIGPAPTLLHDSRSAGYAAHHATSV